MVVTDLMKLRPRVLHGERSELAASGGQHRHHRAVRSSAPGRAHLFRRWAALRRSALGRRGNGRNQGPGHRCSSRAARQHRPSLRGRHADAFALSRAWFQPASRWCAWLRPKLLGAPLEAIYWTRANAEAWIRAGEEQASAIKTFHCELFCARIDADMPVYQIHRLKEAQRQQFRWAPHTPGVTIVKLKDYEPGPAVEAASPYALWLALRDGDNAIAVGDLIEIARRCDPAGRGRAPYSQIHWF